MLQNSDKLRPYDFSFRNWLQAECERLAVRSFPPDDFRKVISAGVKPSTIEQALRERLDAEFYMVGPARSAYMLCDWQLWLWTEGRTAIFDTFKVDSRHKAFVEKFLRHLKPDDEAGFAAWWLGLYPDLPPRLANECIWLAGEKKQVNPW